MKRQHQALLFFLSIQLALTIVSSAWAQHKPPALSEQEVQRIQESN